MNGHTEASWWSQGIGGALVEWAQKMSRDRAVMTMGIRQRLLGDTGEGWDRAKWVYVCLHIWIYAWMDRWVCEGVDGCMSV